MTFFAWRGATSGRVGTGKIGTIVLSVPRGSLEFWRERFDARKIEAQSIISFGDRIIMFRDPDGIDLELVGSDDAREAWKNENVSFEYSILRLAPRNDYTARRFATANVLHEIMGFRFIDGESGHARSALSDESGDKGESTFLDVTQSAPHSGNKWVRPRFITSRFVRATTKPSNCGAKPC